MRRYRFRTGHDHALNLARKARRRGDAKSAELWLKHADRLIAVDHHRETFLHISNLRDAEMLRFAHFDRPPDKDMQLLHEANKWIDLDLEMAREKNARNARLRQDDV